MREMSERACFNKQTGRVCNQRCRLYTDNQCAQVLKTVCSRKWVAHSHCHFGAADVSSDLHAKVLYFPSYTQVNNTLTDGQGIDLGWGERETTAKLRDLARVRT